MTATTARSFENDSDRAHSDDGIDDFPQEVTTRPIDLALSYDNPSEDPP
jgi:hypothetical protein